MEKSKINWSKVIRRTDQEVVGPEDDIGYNVDLVAIVVSLTTTRLF
jgi:hypothetical protein